MQLRLINRPIDLKEKFQKLNFISIAHDHKYLHGTKLPYKLSLIITVVKIIGYRCQHKTATYIVYIEAL